MTTLEATKKAFDSWRITRVHSTSPIPAELWGMVKNLLSTHKISAICKVLHLSNSQIKNHCIRSSIKNPPQLLTGQSLSNDFVEAKPLTFPEMCELTFKTDSKSLSLSLPVSSLRETLLIFEKLL